MILYRTNFRNLIMKSIGAFVSKVSDSGANAVTNFHILLVPHDGRPTTLLHGMAEVVE